MFGIEHELVPFCGLPRRFMYEVDETYAPLAAAKVSVAEVSG